jgi:uncharacterized protein (TIGR02391 family)
VRELMTAVPDVDVLLAMEPEELGAKLLFLLRRRRSDYPNGMFHPDNLSSEMGRQHSFMPQEGYPEIRGDEVNMALAEAWAWLRAQGLVVPAPDANGANGWSVLSRRARKFESEADFANYAAARHLPREALHRSIAGPVWAAFMRGEFDVAVFLALKTVEVSVREAGGYKPTDIGTDLMRKAFAVGKGPLTDKTRPDAEQQATSDMFAGAIGSFKNPQSHRNVSLENPAEAAEIVMFASYLLRVVDGARAK